MTSLRACLAAACLAVAAAAQAQTATADGVTALVRGDVQRAVDILKPLAENPTRPDPAAAFFLGTLYDAGRGLPLDPMRACALYSMAGFDRSSVFADAAGTLVKRMFRTNGAEWYAECGMLAMLGIDHHFEPVTFELGPRHSIEWTLRGATTTYGADVRKFPFPVNLAPRGALFLPLVQTDVPAADAGSPPLHFVQLAFWEPKGNAWSLHWFLYEVSGLELNLAATEESLAKAASREQAAANRTDLRELVDLKANAQGRPAYTIRSEAAAKTVLIETLTEKRDLRAREDARKAADARVDWKAEQDPARVPKMQYVDAAGCQLPFVWAWTGDRAEALTLRHDRASDQRFTGGSFAIGQSGGVQVAIHVYQRAVRDPFCDDTASGQPSETLWHAVSGTVTVEFSPPGVVARQPDARYATFRITGAEFVSTTGARVRPSSPIAFTTLIWSGF